MSKIIGCAGLALVATAAFAAEPNTLTEEEKADGWEDGLLVKAHGPAEMLSSYGRRINILDR